MDTALCASEIRDGRVASMCEFELDDEERRSPTPRSGCARPRADWRSEPSQRLHATVLSQALHAHDVDGASSASRMVSYTTTDDASAVTRSRRDAMRVAIERIFDQYTHFEYPHDGGARRTFESALESLVGRRRKRDDHSLRERDRRRRAVRLSGPLRRRRLRDRFPRTRPTVLRR